MIASIGTRVGFEDVIDISAFSYRTLVILTISYLLSGEESNTMYTVPQSSAFGFPMIPIKPDLNKVDSIYYLSLTAGGARLSRIRLMGRTPHHLHVAEGGPG